MISHYHEMQREKIIRMPMRLLLCVIQTASLTLWLAQCPRALAEESQPATPEQLDFFERRIRPVLVEHCDKCHSSESKTLRGSLRLDFPEGYLRGGDSGPAIVPGKPDESLLLEALRYESYEMPPEGKLPQRVIDDFERWIAWGAPDPREAPTVDPVSAAIAPDAGRNFWAFQPLEQTPVPQVRDEHWPLNELDYFVLAAMEAEGSSPADDADRAALLRRVTFHLTGLPPTPQAIERFLADDSPQAYEHVVDELLDSPRFGEQWARHWLDLARYANSTGGGRSMLYQDAWRYRDYVIQAFNDDRPFDQFIREQLAGDLLSASDPMVKRRQIVATGFLVLGPYNYEDQDKLELRMDVVDEQIDTIGRVFLGLTLGCARCHDHKFDPIPTRDYYALAGIFRSTESVVDANVSKWVTTDLPPTPTELAELSRPTDEERIAGEIARQQALAGIIVLDDRQAKLTGTWQDSTHFKTYIGQGYRHSSDLKSTATWTADLPPGKYAVQIAYNGGDSRTPQASVTISSGSLSETILFDERPQPPLEGLFGELGTYDLEGPVQVTLQPAAEGHTILDGIRFVPVQEGASVPTVPNLSALRKELAKAREAAASENREEQRPPQALSVRDREQPADCELCIRGDVHHLGESVPRGFLSVIDDDGWAPPIQSGSGRRELAEWIASDQNPLTPRVFVNRVWAHLFGQGLVRTVDNFGQAGERPRDRQLLDALARQFIEQHWSIKKLIRTIVLSHAYRLKSVENEQGIHQRRQRLTAEAFHDLMLSVSGELDLTMAGDTVRPSIESEYGYEFTYGRRAIYLPVFRNRLPDLFVMFDFPDPNLSRGSRTESTLSTQALLLLNSEFMQNRAEHTAARLVQLSPDNAARLNWLALACLGRPFTPDEQAPLIEFLGQDPEPSRWARVVQVVLASADCRFLD